MAAELGPVPAKRPAGMPEIDQLADYRPANGMSTSDYRRAAEYRFAESLAESQGRF